MRRNEKAEGFTLVELMIVVAIIGILAAVAIPKFAQMLEKSREGATKGNLGAIRSAVSNYYADQQGWYPISLDTRTYMTSPTQGGTSLPAFCPTYIDAVLPGVKVTGKNTTNVAGAGAGPGSNPTQANTVTTGNWAGPAFATALAYGWKYDGPTTSSNTGATGVVWVNSTQQDMSNLSYTVYGFQ